VKILFPFDEDVHVFPSVENAILFAEPLDAADASHIEPFHATQYAKVEIILDPFEDATHVSPSVEYASTAPFWRPATHIEPFHAAANAILFEHIVAPFAEAVQ